MRAFCDLLTDDLLDQWRAEARARAEAWRNSDHVHVAVGRVDEKLPPFKGWTETITKAQRDQANAHWASITLFLNTITSADTQ